MTVLPARTVTTCPARPGLVPPGPVLPWQEPLVERRLNLPMDPQTRGKKAQELGIRTHRLSGHCDL